jgi:hypothetical protein
MNALTRPLPPSPALGRALLFVAALLPFLVAAWPALLGSAVSTGLGLRTMGRLRWGNNPPDPPFNILALALTAWCAGLLYFSGGMP